MRHRLLALAAALTCSAAFAHDTWFEPRTDGSLSLGTGNRFPRAELAVDDKFFAKSGCRAADGKVHALEKTLFTERGTLLQSKAPRGTAQSCFVELAPFEFDVPNDKVQVYFDEIRPRPEVVAAWNELRARGLPFHERYTKSARIELGGDAPSAQPVGVAMDVLRTEPAGPIAVGATATFQVLRHGKPLADFPVELVNERAPIGLWHRTDAQGIVRARLPLPGRWLLRGTDLHVVDAQPKRFESWFLAYSFEVVR